MGYTKRAMVVCVCTADRERERERERERALIFRRPSQPANRLRG